MMITYLSIVTALQCGKHVCTYVLKKLTPGGRIVKLKKRPIFSVLNESKRSLFMTLIGEKASFTAIVTLSLQFFNCFLMQCVLPLPACVIQKNQQLQGAGQLTSFPIHNFNTRKIPLDSILNAQSPSFFDRQSEILQRMKVNIIINTT